MIIKNFMSENSIARAITAIMIVAILSFLFFYCPPIIFSIVLFFMMCIMIIELKNMMPLSIKFFTLVPLYPILPCIILIYFNQSPQYKILLYYLFLIVFSFDSACYLTGKIYSKFWNSTKIIPSISPGKSWEGFFGGYIITTSLLLIIMKLQNKNFTWDSILLSTIICIIAFAGDIFESYLKRSANVKDSGTILPGHGGLLDRFDSILAVTIFFFFFKNDLIRFFN
ncbi:MAG: phosphatidate cytidylyltransferase [Candidatus Dependentiae bacterium]|nr:phosphatidate cytidylyltransferase [Candidatus Dependentiae bacterium]